MAGISNIDIKTPHSENSAAGYEELSILVRDCIAQSRSAQKKLYDLYAPAAYGIIKRYLYQNDDAAREILNDSFYKIFTKLDQYSFQGAFEGWIRRIVINTVTDHLRKKMKETEMSKEVQEEDAYINSSSVENISYKELLRVLHTLPEQHAAVFNLFVFENYSHKEIGILLGIQENNSRWYLNDARRRLKEKLKSILK